MPSPNIGHRDIANKFDKPRKVAAIAIDREWRAPARGEVFPKPPDRRGNLYRMHVQRAIALAERTFLACMNDDEGFRKIIYLPRRSTRPR